MLGKWHYNCTKISKNMRYFSMGLSAIMSKCQRCEPINLLQTKHPSIEIVKDTVFYVEPIFHEMRPNKDAKVMLFSSPGASGKSTLARHLSHIYNAVYWDLSKIRLGENSFQGTIAKAIGYDHVSEFLKNLCTGKAMLIIDAFDEADMISGRSSVEFLLADLKELSMQSQSPSIILLARTETAFFMEEYCCNNNIPICKYEIGFFPEYNARAFITEKIKANGGQITDIVIQCIDRQFSLIKSLLNDNKDVIDSFLGYAPVLEALYKAYDDQRNTIKLLEGLKKGTNGPGIVWEILNDLMIREQNKVIGALKERWRTRYPDFSNWENIYDPNEQMIRLACFILFRDPSESLYTNQNIPELLQSDYIDAVKGFLVQHPFIQIKAGNNGGTICQFTGPAFRDFLLAYLMSSPDFADLAIEIETMEEMANPSSLLFDFYEIRTNGHINSLLFPYVYDSFKAKESTGRFSEVNIFGANSETAHATFRLGEDGEYEHEFVVDISNDTLSIRHISNVYIEVPSIVRIGDARTSLRIYNSTIHCKKIIWNTSDILIEARLPGSTVIISEEPSDLNMYKLPKFDIRVDDTSCLLVSLKGYTGLHKLRPYDFNVMHQSQCPNKTYFLHAMSKITRSLRKHKKDAPARHIDFINNLVIANDEFRRKVYNFLSDLHVLYIDSDDPNLVKLDTSKAGELGIGWDTNNASIKKAFDQFCVWINS